MKMLQRLFHFESLAESSNVEVAKVGQSLLENIKRCPPKAISPESR